MDKVVADALAAIREDPDGDGRRLPDAARGGNARARETPTKEALLKTITFAVPCYNSAAYMDHCVETLLACGEDIEILHRGRRVDQGRHGGHLRTAGRTEHPDIVRAIHQPNKGHGGAVEHGARERERASTSRWSTPTTGWIAAAMFPLMVYLRSQLDAPSGAGCDDWWWPTTSTTRWTRGEQKVMGYGNVLPEGYEFGWDEVGHLPAEPVPAHALGRTTAPRCCARCILRCPSTPSTWTTSSSTCRCRLRARRMLLLRRGRVPLLHRPRGSDASTRRS